MQMAYFRKNWIGIIENYIQTIEVYYRKVWTTKFLPLKPKEEPKKIFKKNSYNTFLRNLIGLPTEAKADEFTKYDRDLTPINDPKTFNPIRQQNDTKSTFPTLYLWALDTLAIPAMSAEYKRVFSSTKKLITPERNRLSKGSIETSKCLKNQQDCKLITQQEGTEVIHKGSAIDSESGSDSEGDSEL